MTKGGGGGGSGMVKKKDEEIYEQPLTACQCYVFLCFYVCKITLGMVTKCLPTARDGHHMCSNSIRVT